MGKVAKAILSADITGLKERTAEAKKLLMSIGETKVKDDFAKGLEKAIKDDLGKAAKNLQRDIEGIRSVLSDVGKEGGRAFDDKVVQRQVRALAEMQTRLKDIKNTQGQISKQSGGKSLLGGVGRAAVGAASAVGLSVGISSLYSRAQQNSKQRNDIRALTGGSVGGGRSELGFSKQERRQRQTEIARAVGKDMSPGQLREMTNAGEMAERAFGVSTGDQAALTKASRTASGGGGMKALTQTMSAAMAAGLQGSRVTEFLQGMTQSLESMKEGTVIDSGSLRGFAGALSTLPFFKDDPARSFRVAQSLNKTFSEGDRFQQGMAARAIGKAAGSGATPAGMEIRRKMGLFGDVNKMAGVVGKMKGGKGLSEMLKKTTPEKIIQNMLSDTTEATKGLGLDRRIMEFSNRLGMSPVESATIMQGMESGKGISAVNMEKIKNANMTPEDRMAKTFSGTDKQMALLGARVEDLKDVMADKVGKMVGGMAELTSAILSMNAAANIGLAVGAVAGLGGMGVGLGGGGAMAGAAGKAGGLLKGAGKSAGGLLKGAGKGLLKGGGRMLGPAAGIAMAGMSALDFMNAKTAGDKGGAVGSGVGGLGGAYGGGLAGAAIGTALFPGVGTVVGGAIGAGLGAWGGSAAGEALGEAGGDLIFDDDLPVDAKTDNVIDMESAKAKLGKGAGAKAGAVKGAKGAAGGAGGSPLTQNTQALMMLNRTLTRARTAPRGGASRKVGVE